MKQFISTQKKAIERAKELAEINPVLVIETHGFGFEIRPDYFIVDRQYYHGECGKKMFFTPIAYVHPAGVIRYLHRISKAND